MYRIAGWGNNFPFSTTDIVAGFFCFVLLSFVISKNKMARWTEVQVATFSFATQYKSSGLFD